jgi:TonB family protein
MKTNAIRSFMVAIASALLVLRAIAQDPVVETDSIIVCEMGISTPAEFPGGDDAMRSWLAEHYHLPDSLSDLDIYGRVFVDFEIGDDGRIGEVWVKKGLHRSLDREAVRAVLSMPAWKPAMKEGNPVPCRCILPVNFRPSK